MEFINEVTIGKLNSFIVCVSYPTKLAILMETLSILANIQRTHVSAPLTQKAYVLLGEQRKNLSAFYTLIKLSFELFLKL